MRNVIEIKTSHPIEKGSLAFVGMEEFNKSILDKGPVVGYVLESSPSRAGGKHHVTNILLI